MPPQISEKIRNSKFWTFNIGHFLTLLVWLITAAFYFAKIDANLDYLAKEIVDLRKEQKSMSVDINRIDNEGSRRWINETPFNKSLLTSIDTRVTRLEEYIPKIAVMDVKIDFIKAEIEKISKRQQ